MKQVKSCSGTNEIAPVSKLCPTCFVHVLQSFEWSAASILSHRFARFWLFLWEKIRGAWSRKSMNVNLYYEILRWQEGDASKIETNVNLSILSTFWICFKVVPTSIGPSADINATSQINWSDLVWLTVFKLSVFRVVTTSCNKMAPLKSVKWIRIIVVVTMHTFCLHQFDLEINWNGFEEWSSFAWKNV